MDFKIWIRSLFDRKGATDAKESLDTVAKTTGDVEQAGRAAGEELENLGGTGETAGRQTGEAAEQAAEGIGRVSEEAGQAAENVDKIGKSADRVQATVARLRTLMRGAMAVVGIGSIAMITRSVNRFADVIDRARQLTGLTVEQFQRYAFAARQNSATTDDMMMAIHFLNRRSIQMPEIFTKWGISVHDVNGQHRGAIPILHDIADRIQNAASAAERATIANETMELSGRRLVPLLKQGSAALKEWADRAQNLWSEKTLERLADAESAINELKVALTIGAGEMAADLLEIHEKLQALGQPNDARKQAIEEMLALYGEEAEAIASTVGMTARGVVLTMRKQEIEARTLEILKAQARHEEARAASTPWFAMQEHRQARIAYETERQRRETDLLARISEREAEFARLRLPLAEQLALIEEEIAAAKEKAIASGEEEQIARVLELTEERLGLEEAIAGVKEQERKREEEAAATQAERKARLEEEFRILQARARGETERADAMQRDLDIRTEAARIAREAGVSEAEALNYVRARRAEEERIADAKKETVDETKKQISEEERLLAIARKDIEGRTVEGRQARDSLINRGVLSRNAAERREQLLDRGPAGGTPPVPMPVNPPSTATPAPMPVLPDTRGAAEAQARRDEAIAGALEKVAGEVNELRRGAQRMEERIKRLR